jgi:acylpyruvate hydrolase
MDGEKLQDSNTSRLIFDIPTLIATVSEFTTVLPGDVILTGTPGGVGFRRNPQVFLTDGAEITVEVDGVGTLTNRARREN